MLRALACSVVLVACSVSDEIPPRPEPLAALPPPMPVETDRFRDSEACAQCHLAPDDTTVLHSADGANVSPVLLWRSSMMALAARDPYYLAVFQEEITRDPDNAAEVEQLCTRCHGPAGSEELAERGMHLSFDEMTSGTSEAALLARGGVSCSLCHQIAAANLGTDSTFTGKFAVGYKREIFGPYPDPLTSPMMTFVNYKPTLGAHVAKSELCATCHTVILPTASGEIVEQATFLEWRSSELARNGETCQSCHVPTVDEQGVAIVTPVSRVPGTLGARQPVGRHTFVGGNSYMLNILGDAADWSGANVPVDELRAAAARDEAHLGTAARLTITSTRREGDSLVVTVRVENLTGHKLPTGYPSRRMWLHVTASAGGSVVFESGGFDAKGAITGGATHPHRDTISAPSEVQIWEATLVDGGGRPTHRALDARGYSKDDRILPPGFAPTGTDATRTASIGTASDLSFLPGSDEVTYRFAAPPGAQVDVALLFQSLRPETIDAIEKGATPAGTRFVDLARARPITPVVMATTTTTAP